MTASASITRANTVNPFSKLIGNSERNDDKGIILNASSWKYSFHHYTLLVKDYTGTQLSFLGDILLAFEGLGAIFSSKSGRKFFCDHQFNVNLLSIYSTSLLQKLTLENTHKLLCYGDERFCIVVGEPAKDDTSNLRIHHAIH